MRTHIESLHSTGLGGFGHSAADDADTAGREAVRSALAGRVPGAGDLVIVFPSASYDLEALHRAAVEEAAPASVVGATTVGAFTDEAQLSFGCVAAYIAADGLSFGVCHLERDDADIAGCTRRAAEIARDRAGEELEHEHEDRVLVRHRGTQFDASVVDALLALERPGALPAAA